MALRIILTLLLFEKLLYLIIKHNVAATQPPQAGIVIGILKP
jgi:hypothetical protein